MVEHELTELQDIANWEFEDEPRPPMRGARAVVSVAFSRADLQSVVEEAQRQGKKTSEFIRAAALSAADPLRRDPVFRVQSISGSSAVKTTYATTIRVSTRSRRRGGQRWKKPLPTTG